VIVFEPTKYRDIIIDQSHDVVCEVHTTNGIANESWIDVSVEFVEV